ncbi:MAG: tRNA pseudouridine(38-40) synthase TruA [Pseudomonadota bacterium]
MGETISAPATRWALGVEFDGRAFRGWQTQQAGVASVQEALETAISRVANHKVIVHGAGRTDAGVHGSGMVAHFDSAAARSDYNWLMGINTLLPESIAVRWIKPVSPDFHARFKAMARRYHYFVYNHPRRSALLAGRATWHHAALDVQRMQLAADALVGRHDFSAYRAVACQSKRPVRDVHFLRLSRRGDLIRLDIQADGFLHHMVRNIMGVLLAVGDGRADVAWARQVLESCDRTQAGVTAPPDGLYFVEAHYPPEFPLPKDSIGPSWAAAWSE